MQVFWEKGFEGTSMSDLTGVLGIGRQSLYGAFGDKRALFVECLERYVSTVLEQALFQVLDAEGSPLANVRRVFDAWGAYAESPEFRGCMLGNSLAELGSHDSELDGILRWKLDRLRGGFERALTRAKELGELRESADVGALARSLTAFAQGAALVCRIWRDPEAIRATLLGARTLIDVNAA